MNLTDNATSANAGLEVSIGVKVLEFRDFYSAIYLATVAIGTLVALTVYGTFARHTAFNSPSYTLIVSQGITEVTAAIALTSMNIPAIYWGSKSINSIHTIITGIILVDVTLHVTAVALMRLVITLNKPRLRRYLYERKRIWIHVIACHIGAIIAFIPTMLTVGRFFIIDKPKDSDPLTVVNKPETSGSTFQINTGTVLILGCIVIGATCYTYIVVRLNVIYKAVHSERSTAGGQSSHNDTRTIDLTRNEGSISKGTAIVRQRASAISGKRVERSITLQQGIIWTVFLTSKIAFFLNRATAKPGIDIVQTMIFNYLLMAYYFVNPIVYLCCNDRLRTAVASERNTE